MDDHKEIHEWIEYRHHDDIVRDILNADSVAGLAESVTWDEAGEPEVIGNALTSIARSLVTLNELILRGYAKD